MALIMCFRIASKTNTALVRVRFSFPINCVPVTHLNKYLYFPFKIKAESEGVTRWVRCQLVSVDTRRASGSCCWCRQHPRFQYLPTRPWFYWPPLQNFIQLSSHFSNLFLFVFDHILIYI